MGYIYLITNTVTGKKYVGQTISPDIHDRWKSHLKKSSNCLYLKHSLQKYGKESFKFQIICICFDSDCNSYEEDYIKSFNTLSPHGYNIKAGGNNGGKHHTDTKNKISEKLKKYYSNCTPEQKQAHCANLTGAKNPRFGKKMPQEQKDRMSIKIKEKWKNGEYSHTSAARIQTLHASNNLRKRKVIEYLDPVGDQTGDQIINEYDSIQSATANCDVSRKTLKRYCDLGIMYRDHQWKVI